MRGRLDRRRDMRRGRALDPIRNATAVVSNFAGKFPEGAFGGLSVSCVTGVVDPGSDD
jgi:hypothetical protein